MGIFNTGRKRITLENEFKNPEDVTDVVIGDEVSQLPDEKIEEFCIPGGVGETLVREGKLKETTLNRLKKTNSFSRRKQQMTLLVAKESGSEKYNDLVRLRLEEHRILREIDEEFGNKGEEVVRAAEKNVIDGDEPVLPPSFQKTGAEDRISED